MQTQDTANRPQGRHVLIVCGGCGMKARTARRWLLVPGPPACGCTGRFEPPAGVPVIRWTPSAFEWDGDEPYDGPLFDAQCEIDGVVRASLASIAVASLSHPYCREVACELVEEAQAAATLAGAA